MGWDEPPLTSQQRTAVSLPLAHSVLLAGPGTGKTWSLVRRIEYLVSELGVSPRQIVAVTFTRAAAAEMRQRITARLGDEGERIRVSTLHSFALSELLRHEVRAVPHPVRIVGNWEERHVIVEELARLLHRQVREICNGKSDGALDRLADDWDTLSADNEGWAEGYPDAEFLMAFERLRTVYGFSLRQELVYRFLCECRENPGFLTEATIAAVLADEYQDLNMCDQLAIEHLVRCTDSVLFAAGDDDQSIYSFRHAHPTGIRSFASTYEGASPVMLTECHRCAPEIVNLANWLISADSKRYPKNLESATEWTGSVELLRARNPEDEAARVASIVSDEISSGTRPEDILILLKGDKNGTNSNRIDEQLAGLGISAYRPRLVASQDEPDAQRLLEYLLLSSGLAAEVPFVDDLAVRSILELEPEIGMTRLRAVVEHCFTSGQRFTVGVEHLRENPSEYNSTNIQVVAEAVDRIIERARGLQPPDGVEVCDWFGSVCSALGLESANRSKLEELLNGVLGEIELEQGERKSVNIVERLAAGLMNLEDTVSATIEGQVTITTMHGAKGLGAEVAIVLQCEDEYLPGGPDTTEGEEAEARRLLYVSITRAKRRLIIGACLRRPGAHRWSGTVRTEQRSLTRFLSGAPGLILL